MSRAFGLMLLLVASPVFAQQEKGRQFAFLVGVSGYKKTELRPLPFTPNDIDDFRKALVQSGFDEDSIKSLHDRQTNSRFLPEKKKILKELNLLLEGLRDTDTLIVALSGHGVHFRGDKTGYFCPLDAELSDKNSLIPMEGAGGLFELLKGCKAKKKLLIVNACRNDPFSDLAQAARKANFDDEDLDSVPEGIAAIYSCKPGQKSFFDPDRKRGIFFDHVIRAWSGEYQKDSELSIESFFEQVILRTKTDVDKTLGEAQVPVVKREYHGKWLIREGMASVQKPPMVPVVPRPMSSPMPPTKPIPKSSAGFVSLFNGRDTTGWTYRPRTNFKPGQQPWRVLDGVLLGAGSTTQIFSVRDDYGDFVLRAECMINDQGNSGIYIRSQFGSGAPTGYEVQIETNGRDSAKTGSIYPNRDIAKTPQIRKQLVVEKAAHVANEWFTLEITAHAGRIVTKVNDQPTIDWTDEARTYTRGRIGLQLANAATVVKFRKIEIQELK